MKSELPAQLVLLHELSTVSVTLCSYTMSLTQNIISGRKCFFFFATSIQKCCCAVSRSGLKRDYLAISLTRTLRTWDDTTSPLSECMYLLSVHLLVFLVSLQSHITQGYQADLCPQLSGLSSCLTALTLLLFASYPLSCIWSGLLSLVFTSGASF